MGGYGLLVLANIVQAAALWIAAAAVAAAVVGAAIFAWIEYSPDLFELWKNIRQAATSAWIKYSSDLFELWKNVREAICPLDGKGDFAALPIAVNGTICVGLSKVSWECVREGICALVDGKQDLAMLPAAFNGTLQAALGQIEDL